MQLLLLSNATVLNQVVYVAHHCKKFGHVCTKKNRLKWVIHSRIRSDSLKQTGSYESLAQGSHWSCSVFSPE